MNSKRQVKGKLGHVVKFTFDVNVMLISLLMINSDN